MKKIILLTSLILSMSLPVLAETQSAQEIELQIKNTFLGATVVDLTPNNSEEINQKVLIKKERTFLYFVAIKKGNHRNTTNTTSR